MKIKKWEEIINRKDLKYKINKYRFDFQQFKTRRSFDNCIYNGQIDRKEAEKTQNNLLENILDFSNKS